MKLETKKVLVTGAGGFVASHLVKYLHNIGSDVKSFVRYNSRNDYGLIGNFSDNILNQIEVISGDLRDYNAVKKAVKNVDIIFHLGALIAIPYSYIHPKEVIETNIMGTLNVMMAAREYSVSKTVHTSTSEVYGTARYTPITEEHPLQAQSPYSASKIGADKIAESFFDSYELPVTTIRPFNIYGPGQSARAVMPTIIMQALTQKKIFLGSLSPTRDYTYVTDTIEAFIKIAQSDNSIGKTLNIGSNFEISIGDLAKKVCKLIDNDFEIVQEKKRMRPENSEVERLWADNTLAKTCIGWEPKIGLDKGLKLTIEWINNNLELFQIQRYVV